MHKRIRALMILGLLVMVVLLFAMIAALARPAHAAPAAVAVAQDPGPEIPSLAEALGQLTTAAGALAVGGVLSLLLEQAGWFQRLSREAKRATVFAICGVLAIAAYVALAVVPTEAWQAIEPYWQIIAGLFVMWFGSQLTHIWHRSSSALSEPLAGETFVIGVGGEER